MKTIRVCFQSLCVLLLLFDAPAVAQTKNDAPRAVLILDGSGSMWGKLGGSAKISIVRDKLSQVLSKSKPNISLGLLAFGHRKKGRCSDVQLVSPVAPLNVDEFTTKMRKVSPIGKTPMALALRKGAQALDYKKRKGAIILVTDGFDNCRADPCSVARKLKAEGAGLTIHVIGFGESFKELSRLSCIKKEAGGVLKKALTGEELEKSLEDVIALIAPSRDGLTAGEPALEGSGLVARAFLKKGDKPVRNGVRWRVYAAAGNDEAKKKVLAEATGGKVALPLPEGRYKVVAQFGRVQRDHLITVSENKVAKIDVVLDAAALRLGAKASAEGDALPRVTFDVFTQSSETDVFPVSSSIASGSILRLPSGKYKVVARSGLAVVERTLQLNAGDRKDISLIMNIGALKLSAKETEDGPNIRDIFYTVYRMTGNGGAQPIEVVRTAQAEPELLVPASNYIVVAERGLARVQKQLDVTPGGETVGIFNLDSGVIKLRSAAYGSASLLRDQVTYRIYPSGTRARELYRTSQPQPSIRIGTGSYDIVAQFGDLNVISERTVDIVSGKTEELMFEFQAANISLAFLDSNGNRLNKPVVWMILGEKGEQIWRARRSNPQFSLQAGSYTIVAEANGEKFTRQFSLLPGAQKKIEIVAQ